MEDVVTSVLLFTAFISLFILVIFKWFSKRRDLQLPGPVELPVVGSFIQMDKANIHHTLDNWGYKYGDMFRFSLLGRKSLVINTSKLARELYLEEPFSTLSSGRFSSFVNNHIMENSDIALSSLSEEWKHRRKITHTLLRVYGEGLRYIEGILNILLKKMKERLADSLDITVDPVRIVDEFLLDILEILITGQNDNPNIQDMIKELDALWNSEIIKPSNSFTLSKFPWIRFLPCKMARNIHTFLSRRKELFTVLDDMARKDPASNGLYKKFLSVVEEEKKVDKKNKISMKNVQMIIMDIINAGFLTTRGTLLSIIKILISRRDVQSKIQNEIDRVIGRHRIPSLSDREKCPFTEATILESLRYITNSPLTPHETLDEFQFHGINIPKRCLIFVNVWHMHHNEAEWPDPFTFRPERFLDDDGNLLPATDTIRKRLLTFGLGKRSCIGEVFAKSRMFLFLTTLLQQFTVTTPTDTEVPLFHPKEMSPGIVLMPTDFLCKINKRL